MATEARMLEALKNADAAGDKEAATKIAAKIRARRASAAPTTEATPRKPKKKQDTMDTIRGAVESFNQGTTLGFGDEIAGKVRSWLPDSGYDFGDDVSSEEQSSEDAYKMYRDDARNVQDQFAKENKKTALALELAGGIASPVNMLGPGLQAAKGASALKAAGQLGLRGAAEGAIAGAGTADELEDVGSEMLKGGGIGGVLGGTLGGLGRAVSSRKVAQDVMKKGADAADKVPINMIDANTKPEQALASGYRNVLGRVPGSAGVLRRQEAAVLEAAQKKADDALYGLNRTKEAIDLGEQRVTVNAERGLNRATKKIDDELAGTQATMRSQQAEKALPDYVPAEVREKLAGETNPRTVLKQLNKFWGSKGEAFQSIKSQKFKADSKLKRMLEKEFPDLDPDDIPDMVSGKWLMELRNRPAIASGKTSGSAFGAARQDVKKFDKQIRRLLNENGTGTEHFDADIAAYGDYRAYRDAVGKADDLEGVFTGKNLAKTGSKAARETGDAKGQVLGDAVRRSEIAAPKLKKAAAAEAKKLKGDKVRKANMHQQKKDIDVLAKEVKDGLSKTKAKGVAQNVTFPSQLATTIGLAAASPFTGAGVPAVLAASRGLVSEGGQRAVAGQAGWQKLLNEAGDNNDTARLITQLLRQSTSRLPIGD